MPAWLDALTKKYIPASTNSSTGVVTAGKYGNIDLTKLGGLGIAGLTAYGALNKDSAVGKFLGMGGAQQQPVGYQGGIPNYVASRTMVDGTNPAGRVPGSSGQRYFTPTTYAVNQDSPIMGKTKEQIEAENAEALSNRELDDAFMAQLLGSGYNTTVTSTAAAAAKAAADKATADKAAEAKTGTAGTGIFGTGTATAGGETGLTSTTVFPTQAQQELTFSQNVDPIQPGDDMDSLDELKSYIDRAKTAQFDANNQQETTINRGEASMIFQSAQALGLSPQQIADLIGDPAYTEDTVKNYIKTALPHSGYNYAQANNFAQGGLASLRQNGRYLGGATDGMADRVPANINGTQGAKLSDGEFIVPADVVSHLGNGNSNAGSNVLYDMMNKVRKARTGSKEQGRRIDPGKYTPA